MLDQHNYRDVCYNKQFEITSLACKCKMKLMVAKMNIFANARRWGIYLLTLFSSLKIESTPLQHYKSKYNVETIVLVGIQNHFYPILSFSWYGSSTDTHVLLLGSAMFLRDPYYRLLLFGYPIQARPIGALSGYFSSRNWKKTISPVWYRSPHEVKLKQMYMICSSLCGGGRRV